MSRGPSSTVDRPARAYDSLPLVVQRARTQAPLLVAVLAVVVAGATLLGTSALLLTTAQQQALDAAVARADPADVAVRASFEIVDGDAADAVGTAQDVLAGVLGPVDGPTSTWLTSRLHLVTVDEAAADADDLAGLVGTDGPAPALAYLESGDDLAEHSRLVAGRWPSSPAPTGGEDGDPRVREAAVPAEAAARLGLTVGSRLTLTSAVGPEPEPAAGAVPGAPESGTAAEGSGVPVPPPVAVLVVGVFDPSTRTGTAQADADAPWDRDLLGGVGFHPAWEKPATRGAVLLPTYGPLVVDPADLLSGGVQVDHVSLVAQPRLGATQPGDLGGVADAVTGAHRALTAAGEGQVARVHVTSDLPRTLRSAHAQQRVTASGTLVVAVVGGALAATALGLAGRLLSGRRATESALLTARGATRGRLVRQAAAESLALAAAATAVGVPLSVALYGLLARVPLLADAGLRGGEVTGTLLATVAAGSLGLAAVLVGPALRDGGRPARARNARGRDRGVVARSGADLVLVALAAVAYARLVRLPFLPDAGPDPVLVAAPVLCLLAGSVLALRVLPWVARGAERLATRSRRLVLALAAWEVARRPHSTGAAFLLVLATAAATFGVALGATWTGSQTDQADVATGTDLRVVAAVSAPLTQGVDLRTATGGVVSPVTDRPVVLGTAVGTGSATSDTRLLAVDTAHADALLRGRLPGGTTWAEVTAGLAPDEAVTGIPLPPGDGVALTVTADAVFDGVAPGAVDGVLLEVVPSVLVQDAVGGRATLTAEAVPVDAQPHVVHVAYAPGEGTPDAAAAELAVVGMRFEVRPAPGSAAPPETAPVVDVRVRAGLTATLAGVPASPPGASAADVSAADIPGVELTGPGAELTQVDGTPTVGARTRIAPAELVGGPRVLVVTAFTPPVDVPVVLTRGLADAVAARVGDELGVDVAGVTVAARVVRVAPYLPSVPRGQAVLADVDALSRAVLAAGGTATTTDGWWVGATPDQSVAAAAVRAASLGEPVTRDAAAAALRGGPLRVGLPAALAVLVAAACMLALAGTALHTAAALDRRAVEVARLQGLGVARRHLVAALLLEHAVVNVLAVVAGAVVGGGTAWTVGPLLVVSDTGQGPVPAARAAWPWPVEGAVLAVLLLGCAAVVVPVAHALVRRATATHLRMDAP